MPWYFNFELFGLSLFTYYLLLISLHIFLFPFRGTLPLLPLFCTFLLFNWRITINLLKFVYFDFCHLQSSSISKSMLNLYMHAYLHVGIHQCSSMCEFMRVCVYICKWVLIFKKHRSQCSYDSIG